MNKEPQARANKSVQPRFSRSGKAGPGDVTVGAPDTLPRPEVTVFLAWLATSNMGKDDPSPIC